MGVTGKKTCNVSYMTQKIIKIFKDFGIDSFKFLADTVAWELIWNPNNDTEYFPKGWKLGFFKFLKTAINCLFIFTCSYLNFFQNTLEIGQALPYEFLRIPSYMLEIKSQQIYALVWMYLYHLFHVMKCSWKRNWE